MVRFLIFRWYLVTGVAHSFSGGHPLDTPLCPRVQCFGFLPCFGWVETLSCLYCTVLYCVSCPDQMMDGDNSIWRIGLGLVPLGPCHSAPSRPVLPPSLQILSVGSPPNSQPKHRLRGWRLPTGAGGLTRPESDASGTGWEMPSSGSSAGAAELFMRPLGERLHPAD